MINKTTVLVYTVPTVLILAIIDLIMFVTIGDWTSQRIIDMVFIHVAFLMFMASGYLTPKANNSNLFGLSNLMIAGAYLAIEVILGMALIFLIEEESNTASVVIQAILLLIFGVVFFMSVGVNRDTAKSDETIRVNHQALVNIQDIMYQAFNAVQDREVKKIVEASYDKSRSISGYNRKGLEEIDAQLLAIAEDIFASATAQDLETLVLQCKEFNSVCDRRVIALKQIQRS